MATRKSPGGGTGASPKSIAADHPQYNPPARAYDADEREHAKFVADARELGYRLAVQCTACGHWLVQSDSVAAHLGPRCRAKAVGR
ncbi:MAG: hypothetical protein CME34_18840 [Gordonia sp.]|nr:hypothetical protein [Gordonia sp. (in: high G+C Gram-positive bacteria)]